MRGFFKMKTNIFLRRLSLVGAIGVSIFLTACGGNNEDENEYENGETIYSSQRQTAENPLANQLALPEAGEEYAVMITNHGEIHIRLFPEFAPLAVENLIGLARQGYYDELIFHRIIEGFMIQGGCPYGQGFGGTSIWGGDFEDEFTPYLQHIRGALSMANRGPATNTSQFFIVQNNDIGPFLRSELEAIYESHLDEFIGYNAQGVAVTYRDVLPPDFIQHYLAYGGTPGLNNVHTVFGQVFYGMDVVDAIAAVPVEAPGQLDRPFDDVIIETIEIRTWQ